MVAATTAALVGLGMSAFWAGVTAYAMVMVVTMAISMVVNEILAPNRDSFGGGSQDMGSSKDPGVQSRLRINTESKVGVGYGTFWVKGAEVFGQASSDFKTAYYALVLTEAISGHANSMKKVFWEEYELFLNPDNGALGAVTIQNGGQYAVGTKPTATVPAPSDPNGTQCTLSVSMTTYFDPETGEPLYDYVSGITKINAGTGYTSGQKVTFSSGSAAATIALSTIGGWVGTAKDAAGNTVSDFNGNLRFQFFPNGLPSTRSNLPNIAWFQNVNNKLSNYSCVVITLKYNRDKQIFGLRDMTFCLQNDLDEPGSVLLDYMTNSLYGCGLSPNQVDTQSLSDLNTFSAELLPSTTSTGATVTLPRYTLNGVVNTNQNCWKNLENMMYSCSCYPRVNNQEGTYGVYIDRAATDIAYYFTDSDIIGASNLVTAEFASCPNQVQVKFPYSIEPATGQPATKFKGQQNTFNLSLPNNVVPANVQANQYTLEYMFVANDVQAKRLAAIDLNNNAIDLSYTFKTNFKALHVVSGDVVAITSKYNGWDNKLFRVLSVAEQEDQATGNITLEFFVKEYDAAVYVDSTVVQYTPAENVNGDSPRAAQSFIPAAPVITGVDLSLPVPSLSLQFTIPSNTVEDQIDIYYMIGTPDTSKAIFMFTVYGSQPDGSFGSGTFTFPVLGNGGLYAPQVIPPGNYYFACKYYNDALGTEFSEVSSRVTWRPQTQQWQDQFAMFRFSVNADGAAMSTDPDGKRYMGIYNSFNPVAPADNTLYQWFDLGSTISRNNQLFFRIYQNRVLTYRLALTNPDSTLWTNAYNFPDPANPIFNLDETTGFYVKTAYQSAGNNYLTSIWNADGSITYLLPKGTNVPGTTPITAISAITVDLEGRVTGFSQSDIMYITIQQWTASSAGQTFTFTHTVGQMLVFLNGIMLDPSDYSETSSGFTIPSTVNGSSVMAISILEQGPSGQVAPFTITSQPTVAGQTDYTFEMNEGCELVFINGSSLANVDYDTPVNNLLRLNAPPTVSGQNLTVVNFRPLNQIAAPFTQALGSTVGGKNSVEMNGSVNPAYVLSAMNGSMLNISDYTATTTAIVLAQPAAFTGDIVQSTSFIAAGAATEPLPAWIPDGEPLGVTLSKMQAKITQLEQNL